MKSRLKILALACQMGAFAVATAATAATAATSVTPEL